MPAEGRAEGARRAVADVFGDFGQREIAPAQQTFGDRHAPGDQVLHRRQADGARRASTRSTSTSRASTSSRAALRSVDSSSTRRTSTASRSTQS